MRRRDMLPLAATPLLAQTPRKPNILWLTCEDMSPNLGCYGDKYATSPNVDKLSTRSLRYRNVWSNAPVCAPARTTIISGMYPPSTGSEHMRSFTSLAAGQKMYPVSLREAGYYCTNNAKEDYNLEHTGKVWDESSQRAHWRKRAKGQPFFSVFNFLITHESQIRTRPHTWIHDPANAPLPPYHPDTREVRQDWAQYYDNITQMDTMVGRVLGELEQDGLVEDTIVFFYSDHGSGMPRSKRWPYNSGLHVPLLVHIPEKYRALAPNDYKPGAATDRLVSFVDLAPTLLSLAGLPSPAHYQGSAFLGPHAAPEQPYIYGFRGRMDERYDMVRSVRDKRYVYIRNYMPHRIYGQHIAYMFETPTTRKWRELYDAGKLTGVQRRFWETKPAEELYDLEKDPSEVNNLAGSQPHAKILERMREAQYHLAVKIRDVGFLPETEFQARSQGGAPYTMARDKTRYPVERVIEMADLATRTPLANVARLVKGLQDSDSGVRYWAAVGLMIAGAQTVTDNAPALEKALSDSSEAVRIAAAEAFARHAGGKQETSALETLVGLADLRSHTVFTALLALNSLDNLGTKTAPYASRIGTLPQENDSINERSRAYVGNLIRKISEGS